MTYRAFTFTGTAALTPDTALSSVTGATPNFILHKLDCEASDVTFSLWDARGCCALGSDVQAVGIKCFFGEPCEPR